MGFRRNAEDAYEGERVVYVQEAPKRTSPMASGFFGALGAMGAIAVVTMFSGSKRAKKECDKEEALED